MLFYPVNFVVSHSSLGTWSGTTRCSPRRRSRFGAGEEDAAAAREVGGDQNGAPGGVETLGKLEENHKEHHRKMEIERNMRISVGFRADLKLSME